MTHDGNPYLKLNDAKDGMTVWLDDGFTCHPAGSVVLSGDKRKAKFACDKGYH